MECSIGCMCGLSCSFLVGFTIVLGKVKTSAKDMWALAYISWHRLEGVCLLVGSKAQNVNVKLHAKF